MRLDLLVGSGRRHGGGSGGGSGGEYVGGCERSCAGCWSRLRKLRTTPVAGRVAFRAFEPFVGLAATLGMPKELASVSLHLGMHFWGTSLECVNCSRF